MANFTPIRQSTYALCRVRMQGDGKYDIVASTKNSLSAPIFKPLETASTKNHGNMEVELLSVGINFRDILNLLGMYPGDAGDPGSDFAGLVTSAGGTNGFSAGDIVWGQSKGGCMRSHIFLEPSRVQHLPNNVSVIEAAGMPTIFLTALACFEALCPARNSSMLVHAASGGLGLALLQLCKYREVNALGTAGSPHKRGFIRDSVIAALDSRSLCFVEDAAVLWGQTGSGLDFVINSLTSPSFVAASMSCLRRGGTFIEVSKRDIHSVSRLLQDRPDIIQDMLAVDFLPSSKVGEGLKRLNALLVAGLIKPITSHFYSIRRLHAALRMFSSANSVGKYIYVDDISTKQFTNTTEAWMISGGSGALGKSVSSFLGSRGHPVSLVSRCGRASINEIDKRYRSITVLKADVGIFEDLRNMLLCSSTKRLYGFVHASGALGDASIHKQSLVKSRPVFASKCHSINTIIMELATLGTRSVVGFGSVASVFSTAGQANYSTANKLLDLAMLKANQMVSITICCIASFYCRLSDEICAGHKGGADELGAMGWQWHGKHTERKEII